MKQFLKLLALFMLLPLAVFVITMYSADGRTDAYYLRFTTPPQSSLIVGTSRAAQGIQPHVLDSVLNATGRTVKTFNYSFAIGYSNYGAPYYKSIQKKLDPAAKNGVFIVAVDPWSIAGDLGTVKAGKPEYEWTFLRTLNNVNMDPNVEYLLEEYDKPLLNILVPDPRKVDDRLLLHEDGWLETNLDLSPSVVADRTSKKVNEYRNTRLNSSAPSPWRLGYLEMTVDLLQKHGTVILVRLPVHSSMMVLEDQLMPTFDRTMELLALRKNVKYLSIPVNDQEWSFTDGNHLVPRDGAKVTKLIAEEFVHP